MENQEQVQENVKATLCNHAGAEVIKRSDLSTLHTQSATELANLLVTA